MTSTLRPGNIVAHVQAILVAGTLSLWSAPALAQATPERLSDNAVKTLIEQVDDARDKFEGNLDGDFKSSTLRSPTGETKVAGALQDYQDNVKKLKDRYTRNYAASAEVTTVLKQSSNINSFMQSQPLTMKGRSEWDTLAGTLKQLAAVYGTTFPMPDGITARRMSDAETAAAAGEVASAANRFKSDLGKISTLPKPDRDAARKDVDALVKHANTVKSRAGDGQPATAELRLLIDVNAKLQTFVAGHSVPTAMANWEAVQGSLGKLRQAFSLAP